jgi:hypothetical protein
MGLIPPSIALVSALALASPTSVTIAVDVLGASDQAPRHPPEVAVAPHLERDLRTTLKFKSYRELAHKELIVALAATGELALPNGGKLRLTPLSYDPAKGMLELRVQNQKEHYDLDTEYSIKDGGTLFVTAGPHEQEVLVLAITPRVH